MKRSIIIGIIALQTIVILCMAVLLSESYNDASRDYPPYTKRLVALAQEATKGSPEAAIEGWDECASIAKIDRFDNNLNTIGLCSNFLYLFIENTIYEGDPEKIRSALGVLSDGGDLGFAERLKIYRSISRTDVKIGGPEVFNSEIETKR
jgi:hypothetical protein